MRRGTNRAHSLPCIASCVGAHRPRPPLRPAAAAGKVQQRLQEAGVRGRTLTLKIMRRKQVGARVWRRC